MVDGDRTLEVFPSTYWPGDEAVSHLLFALKKDGINLELLARVFQAVDSTSICKLLTDRPTSKYTRRIWFLYEWLTGSTLPLEDLAAGNYVDLLDEQEYFTTQSPHKVKRQRINDNLLGGNSFAPIVRKTEKLNLLDEPALMSKCQSLVEDFPTDIIKRALAYLYLKETKSSFEIEHIKPGSERMERFIALLKQAESKDFLSKESLLAIQNQIVDPRFRDSDYRRTQNYVGQTVSYQSEKIHFVCPKPEDLELLMEGLLASHRRMASDLTSILVHAAVISFGFVFLHPFEDGNGRIHRFLLHNILAKRGFSPPGLMFPISAVMLNQLEIYNQALEEFSHPLLQHISYELDEDGKMTVHNQTKDFYRFPDLTKQAEALLFFVNQTIESELRKELQFLSNYDRAKSEIQAIVDMPDRLIDLFIRLCWQNQGKLSERKRKKHFPELTEGEIIKLESAAHPNDSR